MKYLAIFAICLVAPILASLILVCSLGLAFLMQEALFTPEDQKWLLLMFGELTAVIAVLLSIIAAVYSSR